MHRAYCSVLTIEIPHQIIIEAKRPQGSTTADITIDDVEFMDCAPPFTGEGCTGSQFTCANQVRLKNITRITVIS